MLYDLVALFDGGNVGEELIQGVLEDDQLFPDGLELGNGVETLVNTVTVVTYLGLGSIQLELAGYEPCHNEQDVVEAAAYDARADLANTPDSVFCAHGAGYNVPWNEVRAHAHTPPEEA